MPMDRRIAIAKTFPCDKFHKVPFTTSLVQSWVPLFRRKW